MVLAPGHAHLLTIKLQYTLTVFWLRSTLYRDTAPVTAKMVCNRLKMDSMDSDLVWDKRVTNDLVLVKNLSKFEQKQTIITKAEFSKNRSIETEKLLSVLM
jgi:hypothetical protein